MPHLLFSALIGLTVGWLVLGQLLFVHLKRHHPDVYAELGRPSVFMIEGPESSRSGRLFALFILRRDHRLLGDIYLSVLSDFALVYFVVVIVLFLALLAA